VLRKRRDREALEPLWQVMHDDPSGLVRQQAAVALGKIGTAGVMGPLIEGLVHDSDAGVRQACAVGL
jgi:HEAT repeat protein